MSLRLFLPALFLPVLGAAAHAQDMSGMPGMEHPQPAKAGTPAPRTPTPVKGSQQSPSGSQDTSTMPGMSMGGMTIMSGQLGGYSMMRDASGTAWQPDSTPMDGFTWKSAGWTGMVHGYADLVYDHQGGRRGDTQTFSESMLMIMAQHTLGAGTLTLRSMLSLDPAMGPAGYALLLQSGETADGIHPLIDRQHPHDLFMELAGVYSVPVGARSSAFLYIGYPGEPALGPVTFMHRFSGMDDPAAPITHHWLDSTHITYGVITAGFVHGPFKIESSIFTGREPDQFRWDFDRPHLDSYSGRVSFNPDPNWAFQVSYGFLKSPEELTPNVDQRRVTASATYNLPLKGGNWQTTLAWGRNYDHPGNTLDGFLLESAATFGRHTVFGRAENVQKDELFEPPSPLAGQVFRVSDLTLGYVYDLPVAKHLSLGVGIQGAVNFVPAVLRPAYGHDPIGYMPFLRLKIR